MVSMLRLSKVGRIAKIEKFWTDLTFQHKSGFGKKIAMISSETLCTENVVNELCFLLVTHMTYFDIRLGRYGFPKPGFNAGQTGYTGAWLEFWATRWVKLAGF
jgi:hypothetical protein